jgi:glyoxylase-like metal-dependent hydrolase (beta-lactamase superfamily II)
MVLQYKVFVTKRGSSNRDIPSGLDDLKWVPTSHTLIYGERDAVLVDTPLTIDGGQEVLDWVVASGKNLTAIYATHAHGDHFFGNGVLLEKFPNARAVATKEVVDLMAKEVSPKMLSILWNRLFPGEIPPKLVIAEALLEEELELEGEKLKVVRTGHTDTDHTTTLYVPSIGLAVTGDATYNNVHPMLMACPTKEDRDEWIAALDTIAALQPHAVVSGHKDPAQDDDPRVIEETRGYLKDFERLHGKTETVEELYWAMLELYPHRLNPGSLWGSARVAKKEFSLKTLL